jgi:hypothetical protein
MLVENKHIYFKNSSKRYSHTVEGTSSRKSCVFGVEINPTENINQSVFVQYILRKAILYVALSCDPNYTDN